MIMIKDDTPPPKVNVQWQEERKRNRIIKQFFSHIIKLSFQFYRWSFHFLNLITCIWNINYRKYIKFISFIIWCLLSLCETRKTEVNWIFVWISKEIIFYFHSRAYHHKRWVFPLSTSNISIMMKIPSANT